MPVAQSALDAEENAIAIAARVEQFRTDPTMVKIFADLEASYISEWRSGASVEAREGAHAKASVLEDLKRHFQGFVDSGTQASTEKARREREDAPRAPRPGSRI